MRSHSAEAWGRVTCGRKWAVNYELGVTNRRGASVDARCGEAWIEPAGSLAGITSALGGRGRGITRRRNIGQFEPAGRSVTYHPLTLGTFAEHAVDRGAVEQQTHLRSEVWECAPLGFDT